MHRIQGKKKYLREHVFWPHQRKEEGISSMAVFHIPLNQHCIYHFWSICLLFEKKNPLKRGKLELLTEGSRGTFNCLSGKATMSCLSHILHQIAEIMLQLLTTCKDRKIRQLSKWNMQIAFPKEFVKIPESVTISCLQECKLVNISVVTFFGNIGITARIHCN